MPGWEAPLPRFHIVQSFLYEKLHPCKQAGLVGSFTLELSNNRAERSIKPFLIGRKNFLFANQAGHIVNPHENHQGHKGGIPPAE